MIELIIINEVEPIGRNSAMRTSLLEHSMPLAFGIEHRVDVLLDIISNISIERIGYRSDERTSKVHCRGSSLLTPTQTTTIARLQIRVIDRGSWCYRRVEVTYLIGRRIIITLLLLLLLLLSRLRLRRLLLLHLLNLSVIQC